MPPSTRVSTSVADLEVQKLRFFGRIFRRIFDAQPSSLAQAVSPTACDTADGFII